MTDIQIKTYIASQPDNKRPDMETLHQLILKIMPNTKLWYLDGKDENGKIVSNPNIGYGSYIIHYANGNTREFYQIGLSGNTTGMSLYIMGIEDKKYLPNTYEKSIGKASVTGYCIKFKSLRDIHLEVLEQAIKDGIKLSQK